MSSGESYSFISYVCKCMRTYPGVCTSFYIHIYGLLVRVPGFSKKRKQLTLD